MAPFNPDEFLKDSPSASTEFNPDAYLAAAPAPPAGVVSDASADVFARHASGKTPDKYQAAAIAERDRLKAAGASLPEGFTGRAMAGPLLGWGDELGAAMTTPLEMARHGTFDPREGYAYGRARERLARNAATDKTGLPGDIVEGVSGLATLPGNVFARQASAALGGAKEGIKGLIGRITGYGSEGATLGGIQGAGNAETMANVPREATRGAVLGGAFSAPFGAFADVARRSTAVVPSEAELSTLGSRDYRARDRMPVSYSAQSAADRLEQLRQATQQKYGRLDVPETNRTLTNLGDMLRADVQRAQAANAAAGTAAPGSVVPPGGVSGAPNPWQATLSPRELASFRKHIYEGGSAGSPTDERAGTIAAKAMDRMLTRPNPADLAHGTPRDAATVAMLDARGRGNFSAGFRSRTITDEVQKALDTAAGQHSGLNFENILRQNINKAKKREDFSGFNPAEEAGAEKLIQATTKANARREFGNMLGGGGGLGRMAAMGGGGAGGGALASYYYGGDPLLGAAGGLALGVTGRGLRTYGNNAAQRAAEDFAETLRMRSPEYAARAAVAPIGEIGPGLTGPLSAASRNVLALGGGGDIRDAVAGALLQQTGNNDLKRIYIDTPRKDEEQP